MMVPLIFLLLISSENLASESSDTPVSYDDLKSSIEWLQYDAWDIKAKLHKVGYIYEMLREIMAEKEILEQVIHKVCNDDLKCTNGGRAATEDGECSCLYIVWHSMNWDEAVDHCSKNYKGHLAHIHSEKKNDLVKEVSKENPVWIGLSDSEVEGEFKWQGWPENTNKTFPVWKLHYSNFQSGEPNNDGDQDCIAMTKNGQWDDDYCVNEAYFVCETEAEI